MMLTTKFCKKTLKNPVIIASCPATESIAGVRKCKDYGAGAVILKSIARYKDDNFERIPRRVYIDRKGLWATSSFNREVLTREEGLKLADESVRAGGMPIIASIAGLSYELEDWIPLCVDVQNLGVDIIQLDLFYLPKPVVEFVNFTKLIRLLTAIADIIRIPVIPKLNIEIPAYLAAKYFNNIGINGISLLDSVRVNSPISLKNPGAVCYSAINKPGMSSVVGNWQLPLTQHYLHIIGHHTDAEICAGGGLTEADEALELMMMGAKTVQFCTAILKNGYSHISVLVKKMEEIMRKQGYKSLDEIYNISANVSTTDIQAANTTFDGAYSEVNPELCKGCLRCMENGWCSAITALNGKAYIDKEICEGCGFCTFLCKSNAIRINNTKG